MVWTTILTAALFAVPASVDIHERDIALTQANTEKGEFAVITEHKSQQCDWYEQWYESRETNDASTCKHDGYMKDPEMEYYPR